MVVNSEHISKLLSTSNIRLKAQKKGFWRQHLGMHEEAVGNTLYQKTPFSGLQLCNPRKNPLKCFKECPKDAT